LKATEAPAGIQGQTGSEEPPDTLIRYVSQVVDEEPYQSFLPGVVRPTQNRGALYRSGSDLPTP
jgi:hypothetical protein